MPNGRNDKFTSSQGDVCIQIVRIDWLWQVLKVLEGHTARVCSVAISADGAKIASGSDDDTVRVWSTESGEVHASLLAA